MSRNYYDVSSSCNALRPLLQAYKDVIIIVIKKSIYVSKFYLCVYIYTCVCTYMYIYVHTCTHIYFVAGKTKYTFFSHINSHSKTINGGKFQYGIVSLKCFVWKISKSIFSSTFSCQINHQVQAKERYILGSLSSTFCPFVLTNILHFFWITLGSQSTFFKKICTLAPSVSTFILMLTKNCQSGITGFFVRSVETDEILT